jgi:two-component system, NarL family, sensor histidine kinase DesK
MYLALACLALMWPAVAVYQQGEVRGTAAFVSAGAGAAYCVIYGWYCLLGYRARDARFDVATVTALTALAVALDHLDGTVANNYFLIPLLVAGFSLRPKPALVALALIGAVSMVEGVILARQPTEQVVLQTVLVIPSVFLFGGSAMALRYLVDTLGQLRAARAEIAHHAADAERSRIARDLHDLLGHNLSLITLKGELATRLLPEGAPGTDEVRDMLHLSREALQQVREAVSGYRQPTLATELTAARMALQAAGVELEVKQNLGALDREAEAVLGWVVREATTNVIRHSGARLCRILLARVGNEVQVEVVNDGWRVPQAPAGNGLRGLEERVAALGGRLEAAALRGAGYRLRATLPGRDGAGTALLDAEVTA